MTRRQGIRLCCFWLLAVAMLYGLGEILRDHETTLSALYSEPADNVDVFIVGSSHVNAGYDPTQLWRDYGISAVNVYSWSQPMWISYHYILEGLKTQSPRVVVLDLNGMMYGNSTEQPQQTDQTNYLNSFSIDTGLNLWRMAGTVADCGIDLRDPVEFLPLVHYHTRWKNLDEHALTYDPHRDHYFNRGYGFLVEHTPCQPPVTQAAQAPTAPYERAIEYLDKIVALSLQKQFSLVFVLAPYAYQPGEPAIFHWLDDYAAAHDIPFYNYCTEDGERVGLDWATDFSDATHVNYLGAQKLTADLGAILQAGGYRFRTREQLPAAALLDEDTARMQRSIELYEALQSGDSGFLQWVVEEGETLGVCAGGNAAALPPQTLAQLSQLGFDGVERLSKPGGSYAALLESGQVVQQYDPQGETVSCQSADGELCLQSTGSVTLGAQVSWRQAAVGQANACLTLLYYDTVLGRPVYLIKVDETGTFHYTEQTVSQMASQTAS